MASLVSDEFVNKKDIYNLKITNDNYAIHYLLALINSKLFSFMKTKGSTTASKDDFSQLTLSDIRTIPVKKISISITLSKFLLVLKYIVFIAEGLSFSDL